MMSQMVFLRMNERLVEQEGMDKTHFMMKILFHLKMTAILKSGKVKSFINL